MACPVCSGNSPWWSLIFLPPLPWGKSRKLTCENLHNSWAICRQGIASYIPLWSASFSRSVREMIFGLLGREEEAQPGRWSAQRSSRRGPEGLRRQAVLEPKANTTPSSWCLARAWLSCIWVRWRKLGLWAAGTLGSSSGSQTEERAQPSSPNHHVGLFHIWPGAGGQDRRPCFSFPSEVFSLKGNSPLLSVVFSSSPLWKWGGNNNNNNLLWVWEYPWSGGARVSRMKLSCSDASSLWNQQPGEKSPKVSPEWKVNMGK